MASDYSRQILLKEIGAAGQERLTRSRVLIVGAGGLGSPVIQYLAGAGVGHLGVIDADELEASNLHRQPIYAHTDVGRPKADLAGAAIAAINPEVRTTLHARRFDAANARDLVRGHDVVVDCSDNFRTKFLINDAAVLEGRAAVFASVYQYEGQLQVYQPRPTHACLRCLWPDAQIDGVVGNCAAAGVLGPVPGAFGALQALLTLKILLGMHGQLDGELLLIDIMNFSSTKLRAPRNAACAAPACARISALPGGTAGLEIELQSLDDAADRRFEVIDIRSAAEVAVLPTQALHIEMQTLLAEPQRLAQGVSYLLLCATGRRSLEAAQRLRPLGFDVRSLSGGLAALAKKSHAVPK